MKRFSGGWILREEVAPERKHILGFAEVHSKSVVFERSSSCLSEILRVPNLRSGSKTSVRWRFAYPPITESRTKYVHPEILWCERRLKRDFRCR